MRNMGSLGKSKTSYKQFSYVYIHHIWIITNVYEHINEVSMMNSMIEKSLNKIIDKEISRELKSIRETMDRIEEKLDVLYDKASTIE